MRIERARPPLLQVTLHPMELIALVTAARWVAEGTPGELPADAVEQLRQVLDSYDTAMGRLDEVPTSGPSPLRSPGAGAPPDG